MKYLMLPSYNITGRKNGANIWITSEQSTLRTVPLQNNWNDTQRCIIFGTIPNKWRKPNKKGAQITIKQHGLLTQESKRRQLSRGSGPREARLACMDLTQLEIVLRGEPSLSISFHTMASPNIKRRACLGKPRSILS